MVMILFSRALGHSANRGKVYYLHPELFKVSLIQLVCILVRVCKSLFLQYACDGDDKTWLYENKHLPVHGGKVRVGGEGGREGEGG